MPWKESSVKEEGLRFVARLLDGEAMRAVSGIRDFPQDRRQVFNRYRVHGLEALTDRTRRPLHHANQLPTQPEQMIVRLKKEKPHWGAHKIRELPIRRLDGDLRIPAKSTVHAVLDRQGLVKHARQRRRNKAQGIPLSTAMAPNDLRSADY